MKKLFLLATIAMLMGSSVAFANEGGKNKSKGNKPRTEKNVRSLALNLAHPVAIKANVTKVRSSIEL